MMGDDLEVRLSLELAEETDDIEAEDASRRLRRELLDTSVTRVDFESAEGESSSRAKGDPVAWLNLLVTLSAQGGVLQAVISAVQSFVGRGRARAVKIEIGGDKLEIVAATPQDQQKLIDAFLQRHTGGDR